WTGREMITWAGLSGMRPQSRVPDGAPAGSRPFLLHNAGALVRDRPVRDVHLTRQQVRQRGLTVANEDERDAVEPGATKEVAVERREGEGATPLPGRGTERPAPHK